MNEVTRPRPDQPQESADEVPVRIVDCDIHVNPLHGMEIPYCMPEPWVSKGFRELLVAGGMLGSSVIFAAPNEGRRLDAYTPLGPSGSDAGTTRRGGRRDHHPDD